MKCCLVVFHVLTMPTIVNCWRHSRRFRTLFTFYHVTRSLYSRLRFVFALNIDSKNICNNFLFDSVL